MIPTLQPASASMRRTLPGGFPMQLILGFLLILWIVLPMAPVFLWSIAGQWRAPAVLPSSYSLQGFSALITPDTARAAASSLSLGFGVAMIATPLGYLGAVAVRGLPAVPGRAVEFVLLAPLAIPPFALVMGSNVALLRLYVSPTFGVILVLVVTALPYTAFMFRSALASYDQRFEEVARSLGASPGQAARTVRYPLLASAAARAFFLAFLVGWGDYIATLLIGGGQLRTLPMLLGSAASATGNEQLTAALSLTIIVPPLILLAGLTLPARVRGRQ
ncbi:ABC transporter permease subunit [Arthrobacter sp. H20]|uniref:ABC transporter permease n=1 Tax=Arthrobacter sp. H20 TaxID=1267981 RepID=UPI0004B54B60|nr:ABC transporter permease subunit [Arthrobacter sp. H20]